MLPFHRSCSASVKVPHLTFDIIYSVSQEHMDKTWLASQTKEEEVLGIQSFFVPGRVLLENQSKGVRTQTS